MARPLRIEFAGALYHVTAHGNAREDIYSDATDRPQFLSVGETYWSGHSTLAPAGEHLGVSYATVSKTVKRAEGRGQNVKRKALLQLEPSLTGCGWTSIGNRERGMGGRLTRHGMEDSSTAPYIFFQSCYEKEGLAIRSWWRNAQRSDECRQDRPKANGTCHPYFTTR